MSLHEFDLIDWIRARTNVSRAGTLGIGDDTAVLPFRAPADALLTTDMLIDGTHFLSGEQDPRDIGHKSLAVNLSDVAAMAGRPLAALLSLALPRNIERPFVEALLEGFIELGNRFDCPLIGGDTNAGRGPLVLSATVIGEATRGRAVCRSGAREADAVLVTGALGGSAAGRHLRFEPLVKEAQALHETVELHAMIDVSDGLAADLHHILDESRVGAIVEASAIPVSPQANGAADGRSPLEHALGDGEDFELLFTVSQKDADRLLQTPPFDLPITQIGRITSERQALLEHPDGTTTTLGRLGWEHEV